MSSADDVRKLAHNIEASARKAEAAGVETLALRMPVKAAFVVADALRHMDRDNDPLGLAPIHLEMLLTEFRGVTDRVDGAIQRYLKRCEAQP